MGDLEREYIRKRFVKFVGDSFGSRQTETLINRNIYKDAKRFVRRIFADNMTQSPTEILARCYKIRQENISKHSETLVKIFTKMLRDSLREYYPKVRR